MDCGWRCGGEGVGQGGDDGCEGVGGKGGGNGEIVDWVVWGEGDSFREVKGVAECCWRDG